jgi:hypothetical protein
MAGAYGIWHVAGELTVSYFLLRLRLVRVIDALRLLRLVIRVLLFLTRREPCATAAVMKYGPALRIPPIILGM